jgi:hypothetical protein
MLAQLCQVAVAAKLAVCGLDSRNPISVGVIISIAVIPSGAVFQAERGISVLGADRLEGFFGC